MKLKNEILWKKMTKISPKLATDVKAQIQEPPRT